MIWYVMYIYRGYHTASLDMDLSVGINIRAINHETSFIHTIFEGTILGLVL